MVNWFARFFVRDYQNVKSPAVRRRYGLMAGIVGIVFNTLLATGKWIVGFVSGSVSVMADAVNNFSDAGSSVVSLVSFKISAMPPDRRHPFGHARMEYIASLIVSFAVIVVGAEFLKSSVEAFFAPERPSFNLLTFIVLGVSVLVKLWLMLFNRQTGKKIKSSVLKATAADCLSDALATCTVLISALVAHFATLPFNLDAVMGVIVAGITLWSGVKIMWDTMNVILGQAPDPETVEKIKEIVLSYPEALGIHDMVVHSYGAGHTMATLHVEVDGRQNVFVSHEAIDAMEQQLMKELNVVATIHLDPIDLGNPRLEATKEEVLTLIQAHYPKVGIHDFRMVPGEKQTNLIFDIEVPFEEKEDAATIENHIRELIHEAHPNFVGVIHSDRV